jgi:CDP-diacylglycerol--glycerol-3-phosphate 3-phosphatidyltransferase
MENNKKNMNLPNIISLIRILLIPVFMFFYLYREIEYGLIIATIVLVIAELTDFLDGYIARKYNMVTDLGKLLDPIADKSFSLTALILVAFDNIVPHPWGIVIIVIFLIRDFAVSALRQIAASKQIIISADKFGKIKSIMLDIALPLLFVAAYVKFNLMMQYTLTFDLLYYSGMAFLAISTVLTIYSGFNYIIKNKQVFK